MSRPRDPLKAGMLSLGFATVVARVLDLGATLVLLTLLTPEDMGLAALALSIGAILESLSGFGIGDALVQAERVSEAEKTSLFWLASGGGLALAALMAAAAPLCAQVYREPALSMLIQVCAVKLVLLGPTVVPLQLLNKEFHFERVGAAQTLATLGDALGRIAFAAAGTGAWALVYGTVLRAGVLLAALLWLCSFRPRLHFAWLEARRFTSFGLTLTGAGILNQLHRNLDYFLIGRFLGTEAVGVYRVAFDVAMHPTEAVISLVNRVAFPIYARAAGDLNALGKIFLRSTRTLLLISLPAAMLIYFATGYILDALAPDRWDSAVPAVRILVWAGLLRAASLVFRQLYVAVGLPHYALADAAIGLAALAAAMLVGLVLYPELGVLAVCLAWLFVYPLLLGAHLRISRRMLAANAWQYARAIWPGASTGLAIAAGLWIVDARLQASHLGARAALLVLVVAGLCIYAGYLRLVLKVGWREVLPSR